jgi:hypothetical protein
MAQTQASALSSASAQASAASREGQTMVASGSKINAVMKSNLDARKAHVGDAVTAESTEALKSHGKVIVPKHSRLLGHITSVSANGKGKAASSVGVLFDEAVTPKGEHIPLQAGISSVLTAAGAASAMAPDAGPEPMPMPMPQVAPAGGGLLGGAGAGLGSVAGSLAGGVTSTTGAALRGTTLSSASGLAGSSVFRASNGVPLQIRTVSLPSGQASGSLLTSDRGDIRLDRGTHVQLQTMSQSSAQMRPGSAGASGSVSAQAGMNHR